MGVFWPAAWDGFPSLHGLGSGRCRPATLAKLSFLVNPIAGMSGAVGLKATDGPGAVAELVKSGAQTDLSCSSGQFLKHLKFLTTRFELMATPRVMGEDVAR